jgi:TetR/AcrR family transcriptional regulator
MNEIAREAEFSIGTLYNFFKNKEELYFSLLSEKMEELNGLVNIREQTGCAREKLEQALDIILDYFEKEKDFFKIFAVHRESFFEATLPGELAEDIHNKMMGYIEELVSVAEDGIGSGEFRSFTAREIATTFMALIHSFVAMWIESEEEYSVRDKKGVIMDIFYNGINNPEKGSEG